ncbi:hypothetical protein EWM64_g7857 [Hericium alpestre]|uniref:DUF6818 domain-containing protein n=1 Tax=Hericium alpestre TaxID=135208 RepID=A0A4Y9ZMS7_9AGAM|nr:hypothetical protein EWM64_g7857 [Hericium alpestre]
MSSSQLPPNCYVDASGQPIMWDGTQWVSYGPRLAMPQGGTQVNAPFPPPGGPNDVPQPNAGLAPPPDSEELARIHGGTPAPVAKSAGSRRSVKYDKKGKGKAVDNGKPATGQKRKYTSTPTRSKVMVLDGDDGDQDSDGNELRPRKRGRRKGVSNYSNDEVNMLLDLVENCLPTGQKGWKVIGHRHREWAIERRLAGRSDKSLENKYKQLLRTTKPTGNAVCPPDVERAHKLESHINDKVSSRELNDSDLTDHAHDTDDSDVTSDDEPHAKKKSIVRAVKTKQPLPMARTRARPSAALDALNRITQSLDPSVQAACDEERSTQLFQMTQFMAMHSQVRDLHATIGRLQAELSESSRRLRDEERRADRAVQQTTMNRMVHDLTHGRAPTAPPPGHPHAFDEHYEVTYSDGGHMSFFGNPEDAMNPDPHGSPRTICHLPNLGPNSPPRPYTAPPLPWSKPERKGSSRCTLRQAEFIQGSSSRPLDVLTRASDSDGDLVSDWEPTPDREMA